MDIPSTIRFVKEVSPSSMLNYTSLRKPAILIGGCGRSGTSMLLSILGAHPRIQAIGIETNVFNQPRRFKSTRLNHWNHQRKIADFLLRSPIKKGADRWCEKTPTNVWYLPELLSEFRQDIRFIHIVRDGRDVVTSVHPTLKGQYWVAPERWVNDVKLGVAMMDHPQVFTIRYEDIVADRGKALIPLFDFFEMELHADVMAHDKKTTVRSINAWEGEVQAVYNTSVEKWKDPQYAEIVDQLNELQAPYQLLQKLGYH